MYFLYFQIFLKNTFSAETVCLTPCHTFLTLLLKKDPFKLAGTSAKQSPLVTNETVY